MMISSLILALNLQQKFEEVTNASICVICIVDEPISLKALCEINQYLKCKNLGKLLPIYHDEKECVFSVVLEELDRGLKVVKRLLWELGVLLSTKIVLAKPGLKLLKDYGEGE